mmetsp:Transcript_11349/g.14782  ORF Transcript_11349/g.14782 Transcript_11349/m.14782 type:complete len:97 (+) Transcript_11349:57-347(+)
MGSFFSATQKFYDFDFQAANNGVKVRRLASADREAAVNVFLRSFSGVGAAPEGLLDWATIDLKEGIPLYESLSKTLFRRIAKKCFVFWETTSSQNV